MSEIFRYSVSSPARVDYFDKSMAIHNLRDRSDMPFALRKGGVKFVVDYFTEWAEAEPLVSITSNKLKDFVYKNIICRFRIPHTIITDNKKQFDGDDFRSFCERFGIKKSFAAVYRP